MENHAKRMRIQRENQAKRNQYLNETILEKIKKKLIKNQMKQLEKLNKPKTIN